MNTLRRIAVYCGSSLGGHPAYGEAAQAMGTAIAKRKMGLVYGGAARGTMGLVADAALAEGGEVIGVIPHGLVALEVAHDGLTRRIDVESLHERKARMTDLSDGLAVLPGGAGTLDELFETLTWLQLAVHDKPACLLNIRGYWDNLLAQLDHCEQEGFLAPQYRKMLGVATTPDELIDWMAAFVPPARPEWQGGGPKA
ncbi:MAG: hypothetical protein ACI8QC_001082 [Planctomycetota bacterium]|jgi:uncharacterized protein (TIGR00730 family)